jgi:hypothetical protein
MAGMNDAANAADMDDADAVEASGASVDMDAADAARAVAEILIALTSLIRLGTHLGHLELLGH